MIRPSAQTQPTSPAITVRSEFAHVTVRLDNSANGPRLMIHDEIHGVSRMVDPLELECLTRAVTAELDRYLPLEGHDPDGPL